MELIKSSIFIRLTWKLKRICIWGHWLQPPIIFLVQFVLGISQQSCSARCLSCLFVCLWTGYLKKLWTDSDKIWWTGWVCDKNESIRFLWKSGSQNFLVFLHHWKIALNLYHISKICGRNQTKHGGNVRCVTRTNWFNFGEDLYLSGDMRSTECHFSFFSVFSRTAYPIDTKFSP